MAYARIDPLTREIILRVGRIVPPREARATLHRILDEALDMLATETPIPAVLTEEEPPHG